MGISYANAKAINKVFVREQRILQVNYDKRQITKANNKVLKCNKIMNEFLEIKINSDKKPQKVNDLHMKHRT